MNRLLTSSARAIIAVFGINASVASDGWIAAAGQLAAVDVHEPGQWRALETGSLVAAEETGNDGETKWLAIPNALSAPSLDFFYLILDTQKTSSVNYGLLDFTVKTDGPVWMLTTTRFADSGGSGGNWLDEWSSEDTLRANGWRVGAIGTIQTVFRGTTIVDWLLWERNCKAGESFSIRTEKYQSPIVLRGTTVASELPASGLALRILKSGRTATVEARGVGQYDVEISSDLKTWTTTAVVNLTSNSSFQSISSALYSGKALFYRLKSHQVQQPAENSPPQTSLPQVSFSARTDLRGLTVKITRPLFQTVWWVSHPTELKYIVFPESGQDGTSGTYKYIKTDNTKGSIDISDYWDGRQVGPITFTSETTGTINLPMLKGNFTIEGVASSDASLAPTTAAGLQIQCAVIDGDGVFFADAAGWAADIDSTGSQYSLNGIGFDWRSSGSFRYRRNSGTDATITLTDSIRGIIAGSMTWYSSKHGELLLSSPTGQKQTSVFKFE